MKIVHLTSSRFFGGPERQMLGLAGSLRPGAETLLISFSEGGLCRSFLDQVKLQDFEAVELAHDTPRLLAAASELKTRLQGGNVDLLLCHGYKADLLGFWVARKLRIPVVAVSRGWTGESQRVRFYEAFDRRVLRRMDRVVCVCEGQAQKVRAAGVRAEKITVIHNSIQIDRFGEPDESYRGRLGAWFRHPPRHLVGAAGRLSPEKGFDVLIDAAAKICANRADVGFVLFGDGPLRSTLAAQIERRGLDGRFLLAGFSDEFDRYLPHFDIFVQSSHTEGLPNVILEASAAKVPVLATAVGGTPELIADGENGLLIPPGDAAALVCRLCELLDDRQKREALGEEGRKRVERHFAFASQAEKYCKLFSEVLGKEIHTDNASVGEEFVSTS